ncbi:hypothetical protein ABZ901_10545 [Actinacidiphila alni]|uniref:effector-associated constant component EACC1 n=1 Tax=Actinacidiphila alni TaxID=380248 RepID=UPI0033EC7947
MRLVVGVEEGPPEKPRYGADTGPQSLERQLRNDGGDDWLVAPSPPFTHHTAEEPAQIDVQLVSTSGVVPLARSLLSWLDARDGRTRLTVRRAGRPETVEVTAGPPDRLATALAGLLTDAPSGSGDAGARPTAPYVSDHDVRFGDVAARPGSSHFSSGHSTYNDSGPLGVTPPGPPFGDDDEDE